jgi:hypothetical protein
MYGWDGVRARLRGSRGPLDSTDVWPRIERSLAGGAAIELPMEPHRLLPRLGLYGALALATGVVLAAPETNPPPAASAVSPLDWPWPILPSVAFAQSADVRHLPAIAPPDGSRLRPGRWVYRWTLGPDEQAGHAFVASGTDTVTVRRGELRGEPVWLVTLDIHRTSGLGAGRLDSTYLRTSDLQPLREAVFWVRPERLGTAMELDWDLARGELRWRYLVPGGSGRDTTATLGLPRGVSSAWRGGGAWITQMPILLAGLEFSEGWSGSVPTLMPRLHRIDSDSMIQLGWIDLRVAGRRKLSVPAGTFDCWRISKSLPGNEDRTNIIDLWVDRQSGVLVKEETRGHSDFPHRRELVAVLP